jgi:hypothetical protein
MATERGNRTSRKGLGPGGLRMISTPKKIHQNAMLYLIRVEVLGFCTGRSWSTFLFSKERSIALMSLQLKKVLLVP